MKHYGIIAIGYNRPGSMLRLLSALKRAEFPQNSEIMLIVSIDYSGDNGTQKVAEEFEWAHGPKVIRAYTENLGLRAHVLRCGGYMEEYGLDAVAVFEDDVVPSRAFFYYMDACVTAYADCPQVAGISLYTHRSNVNADMPFEPQLSMYDVYFMQFPQSWGQVWMRKQWKEFAEWYASAENDHVFSRPEMPGYVASWPKTSWLKYHIKYCIEKNLFFAYPYVAYASCYADAGVHYKANSARLQVPMLQVPPAGYRLPSSPEQTVRYDAYFERITTTDIALDLYGQKRAPFGGCRYVASSQILPYAKVGGYGLYLKPHEVNVLEHTAGDAIMLYDTEQPAKVQQETQEEAQARAMLRLSYYHAFHPQELKRHRKTAENMADKLISMRPVPRPLWYRICRKVYRTVFKRSK